jgi:hypothetical protein
VYSGRRLLLAGEGKKRNDEKKKLMSFHLDAPSRRSTRWDCMGNVASARKK